MASLVWVVYLVWLFLNRSIPINYSNCDVLQHLAKNNFPDWGKVYSGDNIKKCYILVLPSPTPRVYSNSSPSSQWCPPTISSSVITFSSHLQSCPASGSFPASQFFTSGGQSIGASASASVFLMNVQDWFHLGLTGFTSLQSKGLSRVFSNTTAQKHQFFGAQFSL